MEKRACERIPVNIEAGFSCNDSFYYGIVTNISKKGMCINTMMRLLFNSEEMDSQETTEEIFPEKGSYLNSA